MFNFIMKPQLLPLSKTANVQHFYDFQGKQLQQKQMQEVTKLEELKKKIQNEELKQRETKSDKDKPEVLQSFSSTNPKDKDFSKSYMLDFSVKNQTKQRQDSTKSFNDFYEKNKKWKQNLEAEILKKKQEKIEQQQRELSQCRKPLSEKQMVQNTSGKQNQNLAHAFDSKGPISGWTERFHSYIKKKLPQNLEQDFRPKINKKSQIIASRMVGKVQDRLLKFGEILKIRKHEMVIEEIEKIGKLPNSDTNFISTNSNKSEFFHRLYKEAEKTNRKTKEKFEEAIKNEFSYKPKITKLDESMDKKIKEKREKSPLYTAKKMTKQETKRLMEIFEKETGHMVKEGNFDNFMKRNELLLEKKGKNMEKKLKEEVMKAQSELKECTFIPTLNKKSLRMLTKMENDGISEAQEENEDDFPLQESPSSQRLFNDDKQNGQNKHVSKYSYNHSYTEPNEFDYSINTLSAEKWNVENLFQLKTDSKSQSKPNEVSEIDSLEFSGQKQQFNNFFNKQIFSKENHSPTDINQDEIINYELTFSNKKLTQELKSFNSEIEEEKKKEIVQEPTGHLESEVEKRTMNDWENQLEKVKNRLQNLMKSNKKNTK